MSPHGKTSSSKVRLLEKNKKLKAKIDKLKQEKIALKKAHEGELKVAKAAAKAAEQQIVLKIHHDFPFRSAAEYRTGTARWYWEETQRFIGMNGEPDLLGDTNFIAYSKNISDKLELAYRRYKKWGINSPVRLKLNKKETDFTNSGLDYEINFQKLTQKNVQTKYKRKIVRVGDARFKDLYLPDELPSDVDSSEDDSISGDSDDESSSEEEDDDNFGDGDDDEEEEEEDSSQEEECYEALLPASRGQLVKVLKFHHSGGWVLGQVINDNCKLPVPDPGWLPRCVTETLGKDDSLTLFPPSWDLTNERPKIALQEESDEYKSVTKEFIDAFRTCDVSEDSIEKIERIQNFEQWRMYEAKSKSVVSRYEKNPACLVNNKNPNGLERRLFHGTAKNNVKGIIKHGFNRSFSFCNSSRTMYGNGVYFASKSSYSDRFAKPDSNDMQRMFLCRVLVGDWCKGQDGQLIPDSKPHNHLESFDTTVNNIRHPGIFVTYHDAQAYPEYLISYIKD